MNAGSATKYMRFGAIPPEHGPDRLPGRADGYLEAPGVNHRTGW
jgi:hypothetical protein